MLKAKRQQGLTLVEVMIAMTLSLILLAGVLEIFTSSRQAYRLQEALSEVQENGRFAVELIARDIRMADYYGCFSASTFRDQMQEDIQNLGNPAWQPQAYFLNQADPNNGGMGGDSVTGTDGNGPNGSDTITIQSATGNSITVNGFNPVAASINVNANNGLQQGQIVILTNCASANLFQITNANPNDSGTVVGNQGAVVMPGNRSQINTVDFDPGNTRIFSFARTTYGLGDDNGELALFRTTSSGAFAQRQALVRGVENMQILYGEDTDADQTANRYVNAGAVGSWGDVVSVRIALLTRSTHRNVTLTEQQYTYNGEEHRAVDRHLYRSFTTTVAIRNRVN